MIFSDLQFECVFKKTYFYLYVSVYVSVFMLQDVIHMYSILNKVLFYDLVTGGNLLF